MSHTLHYLSYYFPPVPSVAAKRNYHIYTEMAKKYDASILYTTSNIRSFSNKNQINSESIVLIPTLDYRTILRLLNRRKSNDAIHYDETKKQNPFIRFLIKLNETLPFSLFLGEGGLIFIIMATIRMLRDLSKSGQNTVVTSFRPAADVIVGYIIRILRPDTRWIVSMHDIPVVNNRPNAYLLSLQNRVWRRLLRKADIVIGATEGVSETLNTYGVQALTLRNGIEIRTPKSANNPEFTIVFTGSVYRSLMQPEILFECVETLIREGIIESKHLKIIYAGKDSHFWNTAARSFEYIRPSMETKRMIPHNEALELQIHANINYLMSWNDDHTHGVLTGKLFEYLGAGNPIITVINGKYDPEFEWIFEKYQCGKIFYSSETHFKTGLKKYIADLYNLWLSGNFYQAYNSEEHLQGMSWEYNVHQCFKD